MEISVVVPSYKHINHIQKCVQSLLQQDFHLPYEIIVVDSSPAEMQGELDALFAHEPKVRLMKLSQQTFPGSARNIGIKEAKGKKIGLIDADCAAEPGWLSCIDREVTDNMVICGAIKNGTPSSIWGTAGFLVEFNSFLETDVERQEIEGASSGNFACMRELFDKYGYFSDDRAFEDFLFAKNLKDQGGKVYRLKDFVITHHNRTSGQEVIRNIRMLGTQSARVRKKHGMPPQIMFKYPVLAAGLLPFRYLSGLSRIVKSRHLFSYILLTPAVLLLMANWTLGFYRGAR